VDLPEIMNIVALVVGVATGIVALWASRQLSKRMERKTLGERDLKDRLLSEQKRLELLAEVVNDKEREIGSLKSELTEKDKKIAELKERIRFAERVSSRDIDRIRMMLTSMSDTIKELMERLEKTEKRRGSE
jgi:predicted RNase H-like nuclease (RuvC/YqgF family)